MSITKWLSKLVEYMRKLPKFPLILLPTVPSYGGRGGGRGESRELQLPSIWEVGLIVGKIIKYGKFAVVSSHFPVWVSFHIWVFPLHLLHPLFWILYFSIFLSNK